MKNIVNIDAKAAKELIENNQAVIIDVREDYENKEMAIENSHNIPLGKICAEEVKIEKFKNKKIIIHCKSGKRSLMACEKIISQDIDFDIYNLEGGIESWIKQNFKTVSAKNGLLKGLSVERKVQLIISLMILTGLVGNYLFNSAFLILPLIASLGLLNAALTGWCGMAKLVAKISAK